MSMEKNGAINSDTPQQGCCGGGCHSKQSLDAGYDDGLKQLPLFPETDAEADDMEQDLTKDAVDAVEQSSKPQQ